MLHPREELVKESFELALEGMLLAIERLSHSMRIGFTQEEDDSKELLS